MNYYLIKGRAIKNSNPMIEGHYLIEIDSEKINLYSVGIGYTKISGIDEFIINDHHYSLNELRIYCNKLIPLDSLYLRDIH